MGTRRRGTVLVGLAVLAVLCCTPPAWSDLDIGVGVVLADLDLGEALLIGAIGEFFGLETSVVACYHKDHKMGLPEIVGSIYLARLAGVEHHRVAGSKSRGHGWGRIANDLGIHPGTFNKLRKGFDIGKGSDASFEEAVLIWFLSEYYGTPQSKILKLRRATQPLLTIFVALDLASKSGRSLGHVLGERSRGASWKHTATAIGLSDSDLKRPSKPKRGQEFRKGNTGDPSTEGNEQPGKGKGRPHDKGQPRAKGQGKGK